MEHLDPASHRNGDYVPHELAARLLESHFPYTVSGEQPLVIGGSPPREMPFEIPIPDGFVLVGSAQVASRGNRRVVEVVLDTNLPASRVRDAYRNLLSGGDWQEENLDGPGGGGFARGPGGFLISLGRTLARSRRGRPVDIPGLSAVFRDASRQTLVVSAEERENAPTDVRLRLVTGRGPFRRRRNDPEALFVMPLLTPPPRSRTDDEGVHTGHLAPPFDQDHRRELRRPGLGARRRLLLRGVMGRDGRQVEVGFEGDATRRGRMVALRRRHRRPASVDRLDLRGQRAVSLDSGLHRPAAPGLPPPLPPQPARRPHP